MAAEENHVLSRMPGVDQLTPGALRRLVARSAGEQDGEPVGEAVAPMQVSTEAPPPQQQQEDSVPVVTAAESPRATNGG